MMRILHEVEAGVALALARLDLPNNTVRNFDVLLSAVERVAGRPVFVSSSSQFSEEHITGLMVQFASHISIQVRPNDPIAYQRHSCFHEFGHVASGHQSCGLSACLDSLVPVNMRDQVQAIRARPPALLVRKENGVSVLDGTVDGRGDDDAAIIEELIAEGVAFAIFLWLSDSPTAALVFGS